MTYYRYLGHNYDVKVVATYIVVAGGIDQWQAEDEAWEKLEPLFEKKDSDITNVELETDKIEYHGFGKYHVWINANCMVKVTAKSDERAVEIAENLVRQIDYPNCMARISCDGEVAEVEFEPAYDIILENE